MTTDAGSNDTTNNLLDTTTNNLTDTTTYNLTDTTTNNLTDKDNRTTEGNSTTTYNTTDTIDSSGTEKLDGNQQGNKSALEKVIEEYSRSRKGLSGKYTYPQLIMQLRETFINVYMMILRICILSRCSFI